MASSVGLSTGRLSCRSYSFSRQAIGLPHLLFVLLRCLDLGNFPQGQHAVGQGANRRDIVGDDRGHDSEPHCKDAGDTCNVGYENHGPASLHVLIQVAIDEAPRNEIDTLAFLRAIESLIPSPTKQTFLPSFCSFST